MVKKILCIVFSTLLSTPVNAQLAARTVDADYLTRNYGERNYVRNPGAEVNLTNITATGTGIVLTRTTSTPLYGAADLSVNLAQALNNRVTWSLNQFDRALANGSCMASFVVSDVVIGTGAVLHGQVYQGTNLVGQVQIQGGSNPQSYVINFPCGDLSSATTFETRLTTAGTTDTTFRIDDVRVGKATNLLNIGQKEFIGEVRYGFSIGCLFEVNTPSYSNFPIDTDCSTPITSGKATGASGKIPGATFVNLAPGDYLVEANFVAGSPVSGEIVSYRLSDGTNQGGNVRLSDSAGSVTTPVNIQNIFTYNTAVSSVVFQVQGAISFGTNARIVLNDNFTSFSLKVWRIPSQSEVAISPEQASKLKAGEVFPWAGPTCPAGSLLANGQLLNRSDYPQLFAAIGTAHGFTTATNFRLPDYRGRFLRGVDGGAGNDPEAAGRGPMHSGGNTGDNVGSVQGHAFASHNHTSPAHSHSFSGTTGSANYSVGIKVRTETTTYPGGPWVGHSPARSNDIAATGTFNDFPGVEHTHNFSGTTSSTSVTINNTGGSETRPVNAYVNWCVRLYDGGSGNAITQYASSVLNNSDLSPIYNSSTGNWNLKNNSGTTRLSLDNSGNMSSIANFNLSGVISGLTGLNTGIFNYTSGTQNVLTMSSGQTYLFFSQLQNYGPPSSDVRHMNVAIASAAISSSDCRLYELYSGVGTGSGDSYFDLSGCTVRYTGGSGVPSTFVWWIRLR